MDNLPPVIASKLQINPTPAIALQTLLDRSIDYAGLFPPAELPLDKAMSNYLEYVRSPETWMLSTFVLPIGKFPAAATWFQRFDPSRPLRISALGGKSENVSDFNGKLSVALGSIRQLNTTGGPHVSVLQLEIPLPPECDQNLVNAIDSSVDGSGLRVFCEAPARDATRVIELLSRTNSAAKRTLGYKLRTGGVTADAFPTSAEIARALVASARKRVPIKFTAGLHHPVRQFRNEVNGKMHGFLNVLGAGVLAAEYAWDETATIQMLEIEDPKAFVFDNDVFAWREWKITADRIRAHRQLVTSFGSCSFDEPRDDLRALGLL